MERQTFSVGNWDQTKDVEKEENITGCLRSAVMLDGETSNYVDIVQGVAQGCTLSPNSFKVFINDIIDVFEAAKQGVPMQDTVSGLLFADDFVGIFSSP